MIFSALGLSGATGLNAWLPLLLAGVFERVGWVDLVPAWDGLGSTTALVVLGTLFFLDFLGDKVPIVDHGLHALGMVVHPVAGAVMFDAQAGGDLPTIVTLLAGGTTAGLLHTARAGARPTVSGATGGLGAPVISLLEDLASLLLVVVAFALPIVAGLAVLALIAAGFVAIRHLRRLLQRRRAGPDPVPEPHDLR